MRCVFLKPWRVQRLGVYCRIMKKSDQKGIQQIALQRKVNKKLANLHPQNDLFIDSRSQLHSNYYGLRKSRVALESASGKCRVIQNGYIGEDEWSKGAFLEISEIDNCITNHIWGPTL